MTQPSRPFRPENLPLRPVPVQELRLLAGGASWSVDQFLPELESLTPVRGTLTAIHAGHRIELSGEGRTVITLRCDRCLNPFSQPLRFRCSEVVALSVENPGAWLESAAESAQSAESPDGADPADSEQPVDCLDPLGSFEPARWFVEQLSLQRPCRNHCGATCPGPGPLLAAAPLPDPRWAQLSQLSRPG
ncbi:DUF177 domain-containing protein [Synechococcus sp. CS-1325]|uniref:YceD family protein n=1 Tax=unclassified Synechococcus TaxID=2626047 RepID=UPI000DB12F41|nr:MULTISPECIES: DUF177 domain-containing protein [unclassified Synechococcus]PZU99630.1 MAG: metal-binding protein [Cyanobium sp.]MCT0198761.1 DUF177 domain-containing protein [Synechococcus sp. CS-1325]MCT0212898.1 DUF177 domain-containing protein [Synechococcus sp. CS-1326]MCT0231477.1 DUF177 domain-containing protein [Synechococcus sp. CS-1324]MCT0233102.1 DUF177 domain-containing protein [Synechococcus sp. CS-1327]